MKDKEKQIEEMAKEIMKPQDCKGYEDNRGCYFSNGKGCDKCKIERHENAQIMADHLYNAGYRKLPEDSVVLSKGAYESLSSKAKANVVNAVEIRKETAEKILKDIWDNKFETTITIRHNCSKEDVENIGKAFIISIRNKLIELAKQFGVEVEE